MLKLTNYLKDKKQKKPKKSKDSLAVRKEKRDERKREKKREDERKDKEREGKREHRRLVKKDSHSSNSADEDSFSELPAGSSAGSVRKPKFTKEERQEINRTLRGFKDRNSPALSIIVKEIKNNKLEDVVEDEELRKQLFASNSFSSQEFSKDNPEEGAGDFSTFCVKDDEEIEYSKDNPEPGAMDFSTCLFKDEPEEVYSKDNPEPGSMDFGTVCMAEDDEPRSRSATEGATADFLQAVQSAEKTEDWEINILALERGEWVDGMNDMAFRKYKKERPQVYFRDTLRPGSASSDVNG